MSAYKIFKASLNEMDKHLGFPVSYSDYKSNKSSEDLLRYIADREQVGTCYFSNISKMSLVDTWLDHFSQHQITQYTQGDVDGGNIAINNYTLFVVNPDDPEALSKKDIRVFYQDDKGVYSGLTICCITNKASNTNHFMVSITKNVFLPPEQREVTFISQEDFLSDVARKSKDGVFLDEKDIINTINNNLNCEKLSDLVRPLIDEKGMINENTFEKLSARFIPGFNIDDRDSKALLFSELKELVNDEKLCAKYNQLCEADINFYQGNKDDEPFIRNCKDLIESAKIKKSDPAYGLKLDLSLAIIKLELLAALAGRDQNTIDTGQKYGLKEVASILSEQIKSSELEIKAMDFCQLEEAARGGFAFNYVLDKIKKQHKILEPVANQDLPSNKGRAEVVTWIDQLSHKKIPKELSALYPSINELLADLNKYLKSQTLNEASKIHRLLTNELAQWPESRELLQALRQLALDDVNTLKITDDVLSEIIPDKASAGFVTLTKLKEIIDGCYLDGMVKKSNYLNEKLIGLNSLNEIQYDELIEDLTFKLKTKDKNQAPELYLNDSIQDLIKEIKKVKEDPKYIAEDLIQLNNILSSAKAVLDNPIDADDKVEYMTDAAIKFSDQSRAKSFGVLAAVTGVIGAVLLFLGIIGLAPTGGASVLAVAFGAALITYSGMLSSVAYVEREQGLPKYVAVFKEAMKDNKANFKNDMGERNTEGESLDSSSTRSEEGPKQLRT